jgi:hypothetical protein
MPAGRLGTQVGVDDREILNRVRKLVDDERSLRQQARAGELSAEEERERLQQMERTLDQCWDLLRQRRALREASDDPDKAKVRPQDEVEDYLQ